MQTGLLQFGFLPQCQKIMMETQTPKPLDHLLCMLINVNKPMCCRQPTNLVNHSHSKLFTGSLMSWHYLNSGSTTGHNTSNDQILIELNIHLYTFCCICLWRCKWVWQRALPEWRSVSGRGSSVHVRVSCWILWAQLPAQWVQHIWYKWMWNVVYKYLSYK